MLQSVAVKVVALEEFSVDLNFPYCVICGCDLRDTFDVHEDEYGDVICDECFRHRPSQRPNENPPDRFRPQAGVKIRKFSKD